MEDDKKLQNTTKNKDEKNKYEKNKETVNLPVSELSQQAEQETFLLIGNVHANLPALNAVLEDASNRDISEIWNVGDITGYGAFPNDVVRRLRNEKVLNITGNYDRSVLKIKKKRYEDGIEKKNLYEDLNSIKWVYDNISKKNRRYLKSLPKRLRLEIGGKRILLTHNLPGTEQIFPETSDDKLRKFAHLADADVIIFGNSHSQFSRYVDNVLFINPGGIGIQDNGDRRASYATLRTNPFEVKHYLVDYDVEKAVVAIRENYLPEIFAEMTLRGLSQDAVAQELSKNNEIIFEEILQTACRFNYDGEHGKQVSRLAMRLFDELRELHGLGIVERFWLKCASILHDIGLIEGQKGHHKTSLRIILAGQQFPFDERERNIVGSIARYHRKKLPKERHPNFVALHRGEMQKVRVLSAILRVADGLDFTQQSIVRDITCDITPEKVIINCIVSGEAERDKERAIKKGDMFEKVFNRFLTISFA